MTVAVVVFDCNGVAVYGTGGGVGALGTGGGLAGRTINEKHYKRSEPALEEK